MTLKSEEKLLSDRNSTRARTELSKTYRTFLANHPRNTAAQDHFRNGDEDTYSGGAMNFTKGLEHDKSTGLAKKSDFTKFRAAINAGMVETFNDNSKVPVSKDKERDWEAATAGFVMDPQGKDAQAVTMAPARQLLPLSSLIRTEVFQIRFSAVEWFS